VTLLGGHLFLVLAYLVPMLALGSEVRALACVALLGAYYAATDGVLMALTSDLCEPEQRAGGMSLVGTVTSGGRFLGALGFGALWTAYGATAGAFVFAGLLAAAIVASGFVLAAGTRREEPLGRPS
jgi:predicted MFS family arabinose efflux permease